ncbi:MAG: copper amine oxidase N-terminal domain-containing protein, partial [Clostridia bacterium]|nr:copper amine oxidase N-terminal domain-containing protein [Clostridia bacterium]
SVVWDEKTQTIAAVRSYSTTEIEAIGVAVTVGSTAGLRRVWFWDGRTADTSITLDVAPVVVGGRTLVPLRFVVETLGASVTWDEKSRSRFSGSFSRAFSIRSCSFRDSFSR